MRFLGRKPQKIFWVVEFSGGFGGRGAARSVASAIKIPLCAAVHAGVAITWVSLGKGVVEAQFISVL
jgi:hypothetical protein